MLNIDKIYRRIIRCETCQDGSDILTFETNHISRGQRAMAPYTSSALVSEDAQVLRIRSILKGHDDVTIVPERRFAIV